MIQTCRYHCRTCGQHFTSLAAFDSHRSGPWAERICLRGFEILKRDGDRLLEPVAGECRISIARADGPGMEHVPTDEIWRIPHPAELEEEA